MFGKRKREDYKKNNERVELVVIIDDYLDTGLNINQISSMLVELMGGVSMPDDPMNSRGVPYYPSVISTTTCGDALAIRIAATGRSSVIYDRRVQFVEMMNCAKVNR
jgi:hypothetical protein